MRKYVNKSMNEVGHLKKRKKRPKKKLRMPVKIILCVLPLVLFGSVFAKMEWFDRRESQPVITKEKEVKKEVVPPVVKKELTTEEKIRQYISRLTLDEKIGQTLVIDLTVLNNGVASQALSENQIKNIQNYHIGGVTFFANHVTDEAQVQAYTSSLQKNSKIPLFMSVDEEGGSVSRIAVKGNFKVPVLPDMKYIGDTGSTARAELIGTQLGRSLKDLGFNLNFAPVSDVNTNAMNPVIGVRSFSSDPNVAASMVSAEVKGMQQHVSATLKHFPGHGDTNTDTHSGLSTSNATYERLSQVELLPFKAGIAADVDFVMMSHINMLAISSDGKPASMSAAVVQNMLRRDLAFSKLIITDSLQMGAITQNYTPYQAGVNCLSAGVDMVLMPENIPDTVAGIKNGLEMGTYTEKALNDTVYRILKMKVDRKIVTLEQLK